MSIPCIWMQTGATPQVLATLHSGLIDRWRWQEWTNSADAVRACAASVQGTRILIGALPTDVDVVLPYTLTFTHIFGILRV